MLVATAAALALVGLELRDLRLDVAFVGGELLADALVLGLGRLDRGADRGGVVVEPRDLVLAIANQLAELFELTLRGVRLALGPRAIQLLARVLDLLGHRADVDVQVVALLVGGARRSRGRSAASRPGA